MYKSPQDFRDFHQSQFESSMMKFSLLFASLLALSSAAPCKDSQDLVDNLFSDVLGTLLEDEHFVQLLTFFLDHPESFSKMSKYLVSERLVTERSFKGLVDEAFLICDENEKRIADCEEMKKLQQNFSKIRVDLLIDPFNKLMSRVSKIAEKKIGEAHKSH